MDVSVKVILLAFLIRVAEEVKNDERKLEIEKKSIFGFGLFFDAASLSFPSKREIKRGEN